MKREFIQVTYGNKFLFVVFLLSLFLIGCEKKVNNFHLDLYDGYNIKAIDNKIRLYKNDELIKIENDNYKIDQIKYNSDVICLKLKNNNYYMVYYVDSSIYGPYTKETIKKTLDEDSTMTFENDFKNILEMDGLEYE